MNVELNPEGQPCGAKMSCLCYDSQWQQFMGSRQQATFYRGNPIKGI